jgi:hypothetical protein
MEFRSELSELNNAFSHYIFVWEQFFLDNTDILKSNQESLTTEVYTTNVNARQFRVKLELLDKGHKGTFSFILKSIFLLAYAEFEVYMRTFYEFARKIDNDLPHLLTRERIPDDIFLHLKIDITSIFSKEELETFEYIRLRRNRLTHIGGKSKGELAELIRTKGFSLQNYWKTTLVNGIFGIDFQSQNTEKFSQEEIFDVINIWRFLTDKIDSAICQAIGVENIIKNQLVDFEKQFGNKLMNMTAEQVQSKFKTFCLNIFNLKIPKEELAKINFTVK